MLSFIFIRYLSIMALLFIYQGTFLFFHFHPCVFDKSLCSRYNHFIIYTLL